MSELTEHDIRFIAAIEEIVAEVGPDHTYEYAPGNESCLYVHGNQPGCIIGAALHRVGFDLDELSQYEGDSAYDVLKLIGPLDDSLFSSPVRYAADEAQGVQDRGYTWGEALETFRSMLEDYADSDEFDD